MKAADLIWVLAIIIAIWGCVAFRFVRIEGDSMYPYFYDGQIVIINNRVPLGSLQKDDVVVFRAESGFSVKRIVASAGDHIALVDGAVYVNSVRMLPYTYDGNTNVEYILSDGQFFVIGDNHLVSYDSRDYGPVDSNTIIGKVVLAF